MKTKFFNAISLAVIMAMLVTSLALADAATNQSININGGAADTNSLSVSVNVNVLHCPPGGDMAALEVAFRNSTSDPWTVVHAASTAWPGPDADGCNAGVAAPAAFAWTLASGAGGSRTVYARFKHASDEVFAQDDINFIVVISDSTPPVITPNVTGTLGNNGWYVSDVTVSWTVVDNESTPTYSCPPTTINADTAGTTVSCSASSAGGTNSQSVTIKRDATAPTASASASPAPNANGWNNSNVTVSFSGSDALSGIASCSSPVTLSSEGAGQSASGSCSDLAGNVSASATASGINIDKTAPTSSASASPAPNANGWNNTDVTVSFSGSDALSGVDSCSAPVVLSSDGAGQSASGSCTDKAGNVSSSATASGIKIDKTAPSLSPSVSPNPVVLNGSATASPNATDATSGVASSSCDAVVTSSIGTHSVNCTATDFAGNTNSASASYSVVYDWHGFFQPIDNLPVLNKAKAGSAIPVKFSLSGYQGLNIFQAGFPVSTLTTCGSTTTDTIETTVTAGSSSLSYDATTDQYVYVWKTDKSWAGSCRTLTVRLNDGTIHQANFNFTK